MINGTQNGKIVFIPEFLRAQIAAALWPDVRWSPENQVVVHPCDVNVGARQAASALNY